MSVKFRSNISGFNRSDVLGYIQKLAGEKGRLSKENSQLKEELSRANDRIKQLEVLNSVLTKRAADAVLERDDAQKREKEAKDGADASCNAAYETVAQTLAKLDDTIKMADWQLNMLISSSEDAHREMRSALSAADNAIKNADNECRRTLNIQEHEHEDI